MNRNKYRPKDVLDRNFCIPLYQRLFAWGEDQVERLLFDLKECFDSEKFARSAECDRAYYLGMLTAVQNGEYTDLIDGQQRFTVMTLMSIAFRDVEQWRAFFNDGKRLKLIARTEDEEYLKNLAADPDLHSYLNKEERFYSYENIHMKIALKRICNFLEAEFPDDASRERFALNVFSYLTFFMTELPEHYLEQPESLNRYFEVMNSTGRSLEQHEILKVKLLRNQQDSEKLLRIWNVVSQMDKPVIPVREGITDEAYADSYRRAIGLCREGRYDEALANTRLHTEDNDASITTIDVLPVAKKSPCAEAVIEDREDSIISFPEFLLFALDITYSLDGHYTFYQKDKLQDRFKDIIPQSEVSDFYNKMLFYRLLLDYFVVRRDMYNRQYTFTINFRDHSEDTESRARLRQYQSMLTVSTEFYTWLKPYFKKLIEQPCEWLTAAQLLSFLKDEDNGRQCSEDGYPFCLRKMQYSEGIDRYWFWRLDYYLWERRKYYFNEEDMKIVEEYVFRTNRSIEHLHPQNEEHNEPWDPDVTNGFGNLAMISQSFNSAQHHDNVRVKFARIQEQLDNKGLQSLKMLVMYRSATDDHSKWSQDLAKENLDKMCDLLERTAGLKS